MIPDQSLIFFKSKTDLCNVHRNKFKQITYEKKIENNLENKNV